MDGTQTGLSPGAQERELAQVLSWGVREKAFAVGSVTGRSLLRALRKLRAHGLVPDIQYEVMDVMGGTQIWNAHHPDPKWQKRLRASPSNLREARATMDRVRREFPNGVIIDRARDNGPGRIAFRIDPDADSGLSPTAPGASPLERAGPIVEHILSRLAQRLTLTRERPDGSLEVGGDGRPAAVLIYPGVSRPDMVSLDLIPVDAKHCPIDKLAAMLYNAQQLRLDPDQLYFAGNDHNDPFVRAARSGINVIAVGNTPVALKNQLRVLQQQPDVRGKLVIADEHHGEGVIAGMRKLGLVP